MSGSYSLVGIQPSQSIVHHKFVMCLDRRVQWYLSMDETRCVVVGRPLQRVSCTSRVSGKKWGLARKRGESRAFQRKEPV